MRRCMGAWALALAPLAVQAGEPAMLPEGMVQYYCGGVGADERQAMNALEPQANVKLLFVTKKRGGYLADATVSISDGKATRFVTVADGPICLLRLPAGKYRLSAVVADATRVASVEAAASPGKPRQVVFEFPGEAWDGVWASPEEKQQAKE